MTTELTDDDIRERLDVAAIDLAAFYTSVRLGVLLPAVVHLAPGDMTKYEILVVPPDEVFADGEARDVSREYTVVLLNCSGAAYPWTGQDVHPSYAAAKWTTDGARWTGVVLATFLNALAGYLGDR